MAGGGRAGRHYHHRDLPAAQQEASSKSQVKRDDETTKTRSPNVGCFRQFDKRLQRNSLELVPKREQAMTQQERLTHDLHALCSIVLLWSGLSALRHDQSSGTTTEYSDTKTQLISLPRMGADEARRYQARREVMK